MYSMLSVAFLFSGKSHEDFQSRILFTIRCLPSQYLTSTHTPIKRLYIMASIMIFITGMFIIRRVPKKDPYKKNSKSSLFHEEFFSLTSSVCRHPYYLGIVSISVLRLDSSFVIFRKFAHVSCLVVNEWFNVDFMDSSSVLFSRSLPPKSSGRTQFSLKLSSV